MAPALSEHSNQAKATDITATSTGEPAAAARRLISYGSTETSVEQAASLARSDMLDELETNTIWHHQRAGPDSRPLLQQQAHQFSRSSSVSLLLSQKQAADSLDPLEGKRRECGFAHFRFVLGALVLLAVTMVNYANYTIYIAAIEMVSNDVLQSGMTELRAKHLSADPLAANRNAAAPGTCPVESEPMLLERLFERSQVAEQLQLNASQASALEQLAMRLEASALLSSVHERLATGQLVDWTITQRSYIFMAHNLGGILLAVPISRLGLLYGSKLMISLCIFVSGLRMMLLPLVAGRAPFWATFVFELALGGPGTSVGILAYPVVSVWMRPEEANFFLLIGGIFTLIGTAGTNFISTQLLAMQVDWCWCFYLPGVILLANGALWLLLAANRPSESRFVSRAELELLADTIANRTHTKLYEAQLEEQQQQQQQQYQETNNNNNNNNFVGQPNGIQLNRLADYQSCFCSSALERHKCPANKVKRQPNWATIFACPTVWALIASHFAFHWNAKIATLWPTYFANILHLDASTIGLVTGMKGLVALVFGTLFAFATRQLVVKRPFNISLTAYRRLGQLLATLVLAVSVALMVLMDCDLWANTASVLLTPVVTSFNAISHDQMPLDLSAEDSGLLVSVIRVLAMGDIVALPASSFVLSYAPDALAGDRLTWQLVWLLGLAIKVAACLFFALVAKSKPKSYSRLVPAGPCRSSSVW